MLVRIENATRGPHGCIHDVTYVPSARAVPDRHLIEAVVSLHGCGFRCAELDQPLVEGWTREYDFLREGPRLRLERCHAPFMRTLCLLLVLANVLYFIWSQLIDVQVNALDRPVQRRADAPPRIVLAKEAPNLADDRAQESGSAEPTREAPVQSPTQEMARAVEGDALTCTSVGPFAELAEAAQAQAALRGAGFNPKQRVEHGELWVGYWVSVQNISTRADAEDAVETLRSNGLDDVYLMPGGDPSYTLSLGVFSDYQRAQRRADEVRAVGLEPKVEDRKRAGSVYWLDVELPQPGARIDTSIFQADPGKIMRLEMRACPGAA